MPPEDQDVRFVDEEEAFDRPARFMVPVGNQLIVKLEAEKAESEGGIHLPETARERPCRGIVFKAGPGRSLESGGREYMPIGEGCFVMFQLYQGTEMEFFGERFYVIGADAVLCWVGAENVDKLPGWEGPDGAPTPETAVCVS